MEEHVLMHFQAGSSDKMYELWLYQDGEEWSIDYANGRRLAARTRKHKWGPGTFDAAEKRFKQTINEKARKGYQVVEGSDVGTTAAIRDEEQSGIVVNLLNPIDDATPYLTDPEWAMQEKMDGERRVLIWDGKSPRGANRRGMYVPVPANWRAPEPCVLDGEIIGETLYVFDILEINGVNTKPYHFARRLRILEGMFNSCPEGFEGIELVPTEEHAKDMLYSALSGTAEGVVFKHFGAPYEPGRPNSGGNYLKYKFYDTASVIVAERNQQRSVAMKLEDDTFIGNVSIPPNHDVPKVGEVIEVRYLYAYRGGSLFQPIYLGVRNDIAPVECTADQLKYKV